MKTLYFIESMLITTALFGCMPTQTKTIPVNPPAEKSLSTPTPSLARTAIEQGALVIDVRAAEEFATGHYPGAINIPHTLISKKIASIEKDKNKSIVVYCRSGNRAEVAKTELTKGGYLRVINAGGLADIK